MRLTALLLALLSPAAWAAEESAMNAADESSIKSVKRLAETFGITIDELLKNEDEKFDIFQ